MGEGKGEGYPELEAHCFPLYSLSLCVIFHKFIVITYLNITGDALAHHICFSPLCWVCFVRVQMTTKVLYKQKKSMPPKYYLLTE